MCLVTGNAVSLVRVGPRRPTYPEMGVLRSWLNITSFQLSGDRSRCTWKISVNLATMGDRLGLSSGNRLTPAEKADLAVRTGWKMDQRRKAAARQMVRVRSMPLYTQWPRLKSIRGRQYRNASRAGHVKTPSQSRAVYGMAALVTTRFAPVTRAPSVQASHVPGGSLSQGLRFQVYAAIRPYRPAHWGPRGAAWRGPALGTRV